jgi:hypothetical protein
MNNAVEMGLGSMVYIPSFIEIGLGIQKLIGGFTETLNDYHISLYIHVYIHSRIIYKAIEFTQKPTLEQYAFLCFSL